MDAAFETPETLQQAVEFFADAVNCHNFMVAMRWPDGVVTCPSCGSSEVRFLATQNRFECKTKHPRRQFSVKVGTIFEDSPIAIKSWLLAVWMIANCKNGISSYELARDLGVTQKTAWFMLHRIRLAMQGDGGGQLGGEVEVDETFIGGKARNMHAGKRRSKGISRGRAGAGKVAVLGLLERHPEKGKSRVRTMPVALRRKNTLQPIVEKNVADGSTVYSDELRSYDNLGLYYEHKVINHAESYVDGVVHTNGIENFWSLLKRSIKGTYVSVEPFHLFRYLDEQAFRFNQRTVKDAARFCATMAQVTGRRLTYEKLTGAQPEA